MKKDSKMGAACGRIHPIGSGPMVWYQKFEYALGHWMQKATEHVLGCVLCSPGCFSLFRYICLSVSAQEKGLDQGDNLWECQKLWYKGQTGNKPIFPGVQYF